MGKEYNLSLYEYCTHSCVLHHCLVTNSIDSTVPVQCVRYVNNCMEFMNTCRLLLLDLFVLGNRVPSFLATLLPAIRQISLLSLCKPACGMQISVYNLEDRQCFEMLRGGGI